MVCLYERAFTPARKWGSGGIEVAGDGQCAMEEKDTTTWLSAWYKGTKMNRRILLPTVAHTQRCKLYNVQCATVGFRTTMT
jgi:hypothetical protein